MTGIFVDVSLLYFFLARILAAAEFVIILCYLQLMSLVKICIHTEKVKNIYSRLLHGFIGCEPTTD
jgi:hypothetical protein